MEIKKYGRRFWGLYDHAGNLVCVTVYKKGAQEVAKLLAATLGRRKTVRRNPSKRQGHWVVTVRGSGRRGYFSHGAHDFDTDIREAVRFTLKTNAERIARSFQDRPELRGWKFSVAPVLTLLPGGKRNPVPPSSKARIKEAARRFSDFTGHEAEWIDVLETPTIDTAFLVGECDGVLYTCVRDGKKEKYIHRFKKAARPTLASAFDGRNLLILGGGFQFTDRGIVDHD